MMNSAQCPACHFNNIIIGCLSNSRITLAKQPKWVDGLKPSVVVEMNKCQQWTRMWLWSPKSEAHTRPHIGHGVPPVVIGSFAALLWRSLAFAIHRRWSSSNFLAAFWTVARHPDLLAAAVSSSFGWIPAHFRLDLRLSLYLFLGRPWLHLPWDSSP